jgi:hypothetical protein
MYELHDEQRDSHIRNLIGRYEKACMINNQDKRADRVLTYPHAESTPLDSLDPLPFAIDSIQFLMLVRVELFCPYRKLIVETSHDQSIGRYLRSRHI